MGQVNINDPRGPEVTPAAQQPAASSGNTAVAGINFVIVLVVAAVAIVALYLMFQFLGPVLR